MDLFDHALTNPPAFVSLDHLQQVGDIILEVDASLDKRRGVLMQLVKGKKHSSRYESRIWSDAEKRYNAAKGDC